MLYQVLIMQRLFLILNQLRSLQLSNFSPWWDITGHAGASLDSAEMRCANTHSCQYICMDNWSWLTLAFKKACGGCRRVTRTQNQYFHILAANFYLCASHELQSRLWFSCWAELLMRQEESEMLIRLPLSNICKSCNEFPLHFQILAFGVCIEIKCMSVPVENLLERFEYERKESLRFKLSCSLD